MKKLLITFCFLIGAMQLTTAQIDFGATGGFTMASQIRNGSRVGIVSGFNIGAKAKITFSDNFSFQPRLVFIRKGAKFLNGTQRISYIEIPMLANYTFNFGLMLEAGFYASFAIGDAGIFSNNVNTLDFGLIWGLGYDFSNTIGVPIQLTWNPSFGITEADDKGWKNGANSFNLTYFFGGTSSGGSSYKKSKTKKSSGGKKGL